MSDAIGTIDHLVIAVLGLDAAAERYRQMGFCLSPRGVHSAVLGTENHTIMLRQNDYFELLAVRISTDRNARWRHSIAEGGGLAGIAMTTTDAHAAHAIWQERRFAPEPPLKFARPVVCADGRKLEARFEVVSLPDVAETALRIFVCSQPTREAVWLPELLDHANGALGIRRITIDCPDPLASAAQWQKVLPDVRSRPGTGATILDTGRHEIVLRPAGTANARATGIDFVVADIAACGAHLSRMSVPHLATTGRIEIGPDFACNVNIGFEAAS